MSRLIDADALKEEINFTSFLDQNDYCLIRNKIDMAQTVEQPTGEWVRNRTNYKIVCSECRQIALCEGVVVRRSNYCPWCGVKMLNKKGGKEE